MQINGHAFRPRDFVGGHVAIDLVNTMTARSADAIDWLDDYRRLLDWAELTGVFPRRTLRLSGVGAVPIRLPRMPQGPQKDRRSEWCERGDSNSHALPGTGS